MKHLLSIKVWGTKHLLSVKVWGYETFWQKTRGKNRGTKHFANLILGVWNILPISFWGYETFSHTEIKILRPGMQCKKWTASKFLERFQNGASQYSCLGLFLENLAATGYTFLPQDPPPREQNLWKSGNCWLKNKSDIFECAYRKKLVAIQSTLLAAWNTVKC